MRTLLCRYHDVFFSSHRSYSLSTLTASLPPYRVLFCGTDNFAKTALTALHEAKDVCSSIYVLTARDAPNTWQSKKRISASPVKEWARDVGLPHETVPTEGLASYQLPAPFQNSAPDTLLLTASFGHLIPLSMLNMFPTSQRLNLHPSLLPQLSGAAPVQWAIARQMKSTGVSVQSLGERFDSGNIYNQEEVLIPPESTYDSLEQTLSQHGSQLLVNVLRDLPKLSAKSWPQSKAPAHLKPSKAPKLSRSFSDIKWNDWTANEVVARHNGFGYLYPLTTSLTSSKKIILRQVGVFDDIEYLSPTSFQSSQPGTVIYSPHNKSLIVKCKEGYLNIASIQSTGKKQMTAAQWIVGYRHHSDQQGFLFFH